jgi:hypothetical protein
MFRFNSPVYRLENGSVTAIHQETSAIPEADIRCALGLAKQFTQLPVR